MPATLTPEILKEKIQEACNEVDWLGSLTCIRMALRYLNGTNPDVFTALTILRVDFDKFPDCKAWFQLACDCFEASKAIKEENANTNGSMGSSTARAISMYLEELNLNSAIQAYVTDGDKVRQYPKLRAVIEGTIIGCRDHSIPRYCHTCRNRGS